MRSLRLAVCWVVAMAGLLLAGPGPVRAADMPLAGNWKIQVLTGPNELTVWLIEVAEKDGKPAVRVLSGLPNFKNSQVGKADVTVGEIRVTLKANNRDFVVTARVPKGDGPAKSLFGSVQVGPGRDFIRLDRTEDKEVAQDKLNTPAKGGEDLQKALATRGQDANLEREAALKAVLEKYPDTHVGYTAAMNLLQHLAKAGNAGESKPVAEGIATFAAKHGPEMAAFVELPLARALLASEKTASLALEYGRRAEKGLGEKPAPAAEESVLRVIAQALKMSGKAEEAKAIEGRLAKLDAALDEEFLRTNMTFKPKAYAGRKGASTRRALVELFTGAQCPPCVSADIAFDAAAKSYKPGDAILLQYHLHIPGPDALTNADSEARQQFYGKQVQGTPSTFVNGKPTPGLGGFQPHAEEKFGTLSKLIDEALEAEAAAEVKVTASRKGDKLDIQAEVSGVKKPGDGVRLRFVLIEDVVRYPGGNGQRLHHHVVRALPGGTAGIALTEAAGKHSASVDLTELKKTLNNYLDKAALHRPFRDDARPLDLTHLKVVAFIQDNESKEVLNAAQTDIPEAK